MIGAFCAEFISFIFAGVLLCLMLIAGWATLCLVICAIMALASLVGMGVDYLVHLYAFCFWKGK